MRVLIDRQYWIQDVKRLEEPRGIYYGLLGRRLWISQPCLSLQNCKAFMYTNLLPGCRMEKLKSPVNKLFL